MLWIILGIAVLAFIYYRLVKPIRYWSDRGVKQGFPLPIVGHNWGTVTRTQSFTEFTYNIYNMHPNDRYSGIYEFSSPMLLIRDPDLIKQITVKDFDHFMDHRFMISDEADPLFAKNLFALKGQVWRDMRSTISPTYTSSKMRQMFTLMCEAGEQFANYFLKKNQDLLTLEMKDIFTRYANDVVASAAFGIKCDSLEEPENEFYMMGKKANNFRGTFRIFIFFGRFLFPKLFKWLKIQYFPAEVNNFFRKIVAENIEAREKQGIVRPDMIHLLLEARKNGHKPDDVQLGDDAGFATVQESPDASKCATKETEITNLDITSQALMFYFAGFASSASLMSFMAYEIGVNPHVQDRLIQEVDHTYDECNGKLTYDGLLGMKYLDMVLSETLRKWPNGISVDRVCTKPYVIEPTSPNESPVRLEIGDLILLPMFGIHRDPKHYPEPERFDPERFSDENKHRINPFAFIPFGCGPRNCIASRFSLLETKVLFYYVLTNFEIVPVEKTSIPLRISKNDLGMTSEGGFWLGFKRRHKA